MNEVNSLVQWIDSVIGKYNDPVTEGYDALNPVSGTMSKDEISRFRANKPIKGGKSPNPKNGPSPEIREKLKNLRAEFAAKVNIKEDDLTEADQPPNGSNFSPLTAANRPKHKADPRAKAKELKMGRWMGHRD